MREADNERPLCVRLREFRGELKNFKVKNGIGNQRVTNQSKFLSAQEVKMTKYVAPRHFRSFFMALQACIRAASEAAGPQNLVTSVKLKSRTFMAGATMSKDSSPLARIGFPMASTLESISIRL